MNVIIVSDARNVAQKLLFINLRKKLKRPGTGGLNMDIYVMVFNALKEAEKKRIAEKRNKRKE